MSGYLKHFAAVYSIALVLLVTVLIFGFKLGGFTLIPTLIASAFISASHFIKKERRLPTAQEKVQLIWGSSAVALSIGSLFAFFLVMMNPNAESILKSAEEAGLGIYAIFMLLMIALHGVIFHIAYSLYAQRVLRRLISSQ